MVDETAFPDSSTGMEDSQGKTTSHLQQLGGRPSVDQLEQLVDKRVQWLGSVKTSLKVQPVITKTWLEQIERIEGYSTKPKTIIGVVGNTGAGKSSVINAMLDEEQLLPTNTMRACTAVATEISYNYEDGCSYRAEVEFIDEASWDAELKILFSEAIDANGRLVRDASNKESEAGIAYAKIKAVYFQMTNEDIVSSSPSAMLEQVSHILGKTQHVQHNDCLTFYNRLKRYVDSREKLRANMTPEEKKANPKEMEVWPLIKVVRIYCKADVLSTGAVIVDLPGIHDANTARAAVADGYMQQCSGLWIVAPIIRAVDDKAAKTLLGQRFKRQLKMDGGISQVSFICSKTDDISISEASASLGLIAANNGLWQQIKKQYSIQGEIQEDIQIHVNLMDVITKLIKTLDAEQERLERLHLELRNQGPRFTANQKQIETVDLTEGVLASTNSSMQVYQTLQVIDETIAGLRQQKNKYRNEESQVAKDIEQLHDENHQSLMLQKDTELDIIAGCIQGRNQYSKLAIQQDFAMGIRELDEENAQADDANNFDPEEDIRDYDKVAKSLPVFCVSSRAYHQLCGRCQKETKVSGFRGTRETEIPVLQEYCKDLTIINRTQACERFLLAVDTLANSLSIWINSDDMTNYLTENQKHKAEFSLSESMETMHQGLVSVIEAVSTEIKNALDVHLYNGYDSVCNPAQKDAESTSEGWGGGDRANTNSPGGYRWNTYKATCKRRGKYRDIDFNAQLCDPMLKLIAPRWQRLFIQKIPEILSGIILQVQNSFQVFHNEIRAMPHIDALGLAVLPMLEQQLANYTQTYGDAAKVARQTIDEGQKEVNRRFVPFIANVMDPAYAGCISETGPGCFKRMQILMVDHVNKNKETMFKNSCNAVQKDLAKVINGVKQELKHAAAELSKKVLQDYKSALTGDGGLLIEQHRDLRQAISGLLQNMPVAIKLDPQSAEDIVMEK